MKLSLLARVTPTSAGLSFIQRHRQVFADIQEVAVSPGDEMFSNLRRPVDDVLA